MGEVQSKQGKGGAKCRGKKLLKLTCGGCKIYSFIVRKKMGKFYQQHRCASFCRPPGEPSPPSGHLENCHLGLISAKVPTSIIGMMLAFHPVPQPPQASSVPDVPFSLWTPWLLPALPIWLSIPFPLGVQCNQQPHNFSSLPLHSACMPLGVCLEGTWPV